MSELETRDGAELTLRQIMEDNQNGKPATRAAHIGSLNGHTSAIASLGIPTILHEPISANDGGYPTTKILVAGGEVTISDSGEIATAYAIFRSGEYRVDLSPSGIAIAQHKVAHALKGSSVSQTISEMAQSPLRGLLESIGTISYMGKPADILSPRVMELQKRVKTPAQLHYLACKESPELADSIRSASEAILLRADVAYDVISAFTSCPSVFSEYVTKAGERLGLKHISPEEIVYEGGNEQRIVNRSRLAIETMDYLKWQQQAITNPEYNPITSPQEGPVLSGLGYVAVLTAIDLLTRTQVTDSKAVVRHIGGNEMHRYMLDQTDPESEYRRQQLSGLYNIASAALRGTLPKQVVMDLIPGKEITPFVFSGPTADLGSEVASLYAEWQGLNIYKLDINRRVRQKMLDDLGITTPESLNTHQMHLLIDILEKGDTVTEEDLRDAKRLRDKVTEGKAKEPEVFGRVAKSISSREGSGNDKRILEIDNHVRRSVSESILGRNIIQRRGGMTLSQYDVLENGIVVPEAALHLPFNEMSGTLNWVINRCNLPK